MARDEVERFHLPAYSWRGGGLRTVLPMRSFPKSSMLHALRRQRAVAISTPLAALAGIALLTGCSGEASSGDDVAAADGATTPAAAPCTNDAGLTLPEGFCGMVFADGLGQPRHLTVREDGTVLTVRMGAPDGEGGVVALRDTDSDGKADSRETFGPVGGTGIRLDGEQLYVDAKTAILRYQLPSTDMRPSAEPDTIVSGLPERGHAARNFVLDGSGGMIVNFGSRTNSCQEKDRQTGSPGVDPCVERDSRAGLWRFSAGQVGQTVADGEHYAIGIRNAVALEQAPNGQLWAAQHGRDQLFQNWGELYTAQQSAENPGEELLLVNQGDDFGWPYCYYDMDRQRMVLAPEYGGNGGEEVGRCADVKGPVVAFPGHWAPMSLLFYTGTQLPARYRDGVFIAFHGSWNRAPEAQAGYNVVFQPLSDGAPTGEYELFATGFPGETVTPAGAAHRPAGLAQGPDGSIYVADDKGGVVYRITYQGR